MGIEKTPLRIPAEWDPIWFEQFVRDALFLMDVRNGIEGAGITISGSASEKVTIATNIGSDVQAWDDDLDDIAALSPTDSNFIVGDGTDWTLETPTQALASLGAAAVANGTWTPVLEGSSTPGTNTYSTQHGTYVKIGTLVYCYFRVTVTALSVAMVGNAEIAGLPFTVVNDATKRGVISVGFFGNVNLATAGAQLGGVPVINTTTASLIESADNAAAVNLAVGAITATADIAGMIIYETA